MTKKILSVFTAFLIAALTIPSVSSSAVEVSAASAVLIEADTGRIIFGKNENEIRPMASTTKIMTTLLCLESGGLDEQFTVDPEAIKTEGSSMGLVEGDIVTKRALCCGMLLPSGNDAANATAVKLSGSYEAFAEMMNARAKQIGMDNTNFVTPSGLEADGHASTAYDMALLTREALKNPDFAEICSKQNIQLSFGNPPYERWLNNTNKLLGMYDGCIGVKTGFTDEAGRCLVSAAERNGVRLICVTLKAPDDWNDHIKMFDYGFSMVKPVLLTDNPKSISIVGGEKDTLSLSGGSEKLTLFTDECNKLVSKTMLPKFVYAPVTAGDEIGEIIYYIDNTQIYSEKIYAAEDIVPPEIPEKKGIFDRISELLE